MSVSTTRAVDRVKGAKRPEHNMFGNKVIGSGVPNSDSDMEEDEEPEDEEPEDEESEDEKEMVYRLVSLFPRPATLEHALAKTFKKMFGRKNTRWRRPAMVQKDRCWALFCKVNQQARASYELAFSGEINAVFVLETDSLMPDIKRNVTINAVYALVAKKISSITRRGTMFRSPIIALDVIADSWMMGKVLTLTDELIFNGYEEFEDSHEPTNADDDADVGNQNRMIALDEMTKSWTGLSDTVDTYIDNKVGYRVASAIVLSDIEAEDPPAIDPMWD